MNNMTEGREIGAMGDNEEVIKEFLLEDFRYWAECFRQNEESGETRVNLFILLAGGTGSAAAFILNGHINSASEDIRSLVLFVLIALLMLGWITFERILTRNESSDKYKNRLDIIRVKFKNHFGPNILSGYCNPSSSQSSGVSKNSLRKFGGLSHTMATINSIIAVGIYGAVVYPLQASGGMVSNFYIHYVMAGLILILGFCLQWFRIVTRERRSKMENGDPQKI